MLNETRANEQLKLTVPELIVDDERINAHSTFYSFDNLMADPKLLSRAFHEYKYLLFNSKSHLKFNDRFEGLSVDICGITIFTRPFSMTFSDIIGKSYYDSAEKLGLAALVDAVVELHQHDVVHRNIIPENLVLIASEAPKYFLRDFSKSGSMLETMMPANLYHSVFIKRNAKWSGGSRNYDMFSIGVMFLNWHLGTSNFKVASKNLLMIESAARKLTNDIFAPRQLRLIIEGTILANHECIMADEVALLVKDLFAINYA